MTLRGCGAFGVAALLLASLSPACSQTANVSDVYMALEADGARRRNQFFTDTKEINCVAEVGIGRDDVTLEILIRRLQLFDLQINDFVNVNVVDPYLEVRPNKTTGTPAKYGLRLVPTSPDENGKAKEDEEAPFIAGRFQCEVYLDGELKGTAIFNIDFPPCPTTFIQTGDRCLGFYRDGTVCPASGATGAPDPTCTCTPTGWQC